MVKINNLWVDQFQDRPSGPRQAFVGHCLLIPKLWQMPHSGASLRVQVRYGKASERVQMTNLQVGQVL